LGRNEDKLHDTQIWRGNLFESSLLEDQVKDDGIVLGLSIEKQLVGMDMEGND
jgi:hypothetical protein